MILRSMLFVPGDSARKQAKAADSAADALILDLEDSVAEQNLPAARRMTQEFLAAHADRSRRQLWVRVNALESHHARDDLAAAMAGHPDGIVVPKVTKPDELTHLESYLSALERREDVVQGRTRIIALAAETPRSLFHLDAYCDCTPRLAGITWGAEDFAVAIGAQSKHEPDGSLTATFALARSLVLVAARAANVQPIDTVFANFRDIEGLGREAQRARRDGFLGKIAIHPDQVPPINAAFTPSAAEVERARKIVAAFDADPDAGVLGIDGQMLDRPHLIQARQLLELASRGGGS